MTHVVDTKSTDNRGSVWRIETNPKYARAWIESLSPLSNTASARELYQGLCVLNRTVLSPGKRYELMQLYQAPVREACEPLQSVIHQVSFPMSLKLRRRAEFVCQLHMEMARGYITCLLGLAKTWLIPWRRQTLVPPAERALYHLSQVLLRCYQLYLPHPTDTWRSAHAIYRLVEKYGRHNDLINADEGEETTRVSVSQRYRRLLLLGAANPYQMPFNECTAVYRFLSGWADQAVIGTSVSDGSTSFLVDLTGNMPPAGLGRASTSTPSANIRWLDTSELTRTLHAMLRRLEKGESASTLKIGVDCLDSTCHDMLQRLHRAFAQTTTRRHSRIKRHETIMICTGVGAVHFFAGGQKPFSSPEAQTATEESHITETNENEAYIPLDEPNTTSARAAPAAENFRIDRWQVQDVCPQGLMISHEKEASVRFRVGDLLGIQRMSTPGQWSVGLVRWCKGHGESGIEVGVELIAPDVAPASITPVANGESARPALMLPAVELTGRQASVIVTSGTMQVGSDCFLKDENHPTRRVRVLDAIERTNSIEQVMVGNVV